jgi:hypothetical protein
MIGLSEAALALLTPCLVTSPIFELWDKGSKFVLLIGRRPLLETGKGLTFITT